MRSNKAIPILLVLFSRAFCATDLEGQVTDLSGNPLPGVLVVSTADRQSTGTDSLGRWEIASVSTGIGHRSVPAGFPATSKPSLESGHLKWTFNGRNAAGRFNDHQNPRSPRTNAAVAGRSFEQGADSLLLAWNGRVRARIALASFLTGEIRKIDTSTTDMDLPWNSSISFQTLVDPRDRQVYRTVAIGSLIWMAQNLNFRNLAGKPDTIGVWYQGDADSGIKYGRLYTWVDALAGQRSAGNLQGICPPQWHLPSEVEWTGLMRAVDSPNVEAGRELKSVRGWPAAAEGTDLHGFRALPGGSCNTTSCNGAGSYAIWRGTLDYDKIRASVRVLSAGSGAISSPLDAGKTAMFSIRCIKD